MLPSGVSKDSVRALYEVLAGQPMYIARGTGYTAYATPTDMLTITGSATKVIRVYLMSVRVHTTAGALQSIHFVKRSTANTGGTLTNPTPIAHDANSPTASATVSLYTAAPTTGDGSTFLTASVVTTVPTAVPAGFTLASQFSNIAVPATIDPIVLRGTAQSLCANFAGAALPAGFTAAWDIVWSESST